MTELHKNEEYINPNIEEDEDYDMLIRETKLRFPEVEDFIISMAVKAHLNIQKLGDKYQEKTKEECEEYKKKYFTGLEYKTEF